MLMLILSLLLLVKYSISSNVFDSIKLCQDSTFQIKGASKFYKTLRGVIEEDTDTTRSYVNDLYNVTFAIKQNYDDIKKILYDVSDPDSSNYRNYLTREEIGSISSNRVYSKKVIDILNSVKDIEIIKTTIDDEYITVQGTISTFEDLFNSTFTKFSYNGKEVYRMKEYSLPKCIHNEIALVYNVIDHPAHLFMKKKKSMNTQFRRPLSKSSSISTGLGTPTFAPTPTVMCDNGPDGSCIFNENVTIVTPQYISNLYSIKSNTGSDKVSQGVFETAGQIYSLADLYSFENEFGLPNESKYVKNIGGNVVTGACPNSNSCDEANLDIQYITGIAQKVPTTGWYESSTSSPFLTWILAMADTKNPPMVMSMSYSTYENSMDSSELNQWDTEAMKLGTQGVSIIVSAGDQGVSGYLYQNYLTISWQSYCGYGPQFPASSPYVTTVGGTQGYPTEKPAQCDSGGAITTGGGFSNFYATPSFQENQVSGYFKNVQTQPFENSNAIFGNGAAGLLSGTFNTRGRSYPDISAWSSFVYVVIGGYIYPIAGTSVAAPVFAAMVTLTNSNNHRHGKRSMGWLNPFLYKYSSDFVNDITTGNNKGLEADSSQFFGTGCNVCTYGFYASVGYDPVSGLGTINFENFSDKALKVTPRLPLTKWQIALIVVGTIITFAAIVAGIYLYRKKRARTALALSPSLAQPINESTTTNPITQSVEIRNRIEV